MRQTMLEAHPNASGQFDVKHDRGGLIDVEFIVQYLVLGHAHQHAALTGNIGNLALLKLAAERVRRNSWEAKLVMDKCPLLCAGRDGDEGDACHSGDDEHMCMLCGLALPSLTAANDHMARIHGCGHDTEVLPLCPDAVCPVCGTDFRSRLRVIAHLRARATVQATAGSWRRGAAGACRALLLAGGYPRMSEAELLAANESDRLHRKACRAAGISVLSAGGFACRAPAMVPEPLCAL